MPDSDAIPAPSNVPEPNVPPVDEPSKNPPAEVPDGKPEPQVKLPENAEHDLTKNHPDAEDDRAGRRDPNILEKEEMETQR